MLRPTLGDFSSIVCFKSAVVGIEDALGEKAAAIALIAAGPGLTQLAQCRDFLDKRVKWEESCFQGRSRFANSSASGNAEHQTATS